MRLLVERTLDTGQERVALLSEVDSDILAQLRPLVREAIKSGRHVHVGGAGGARSLWIRAGWRRSRCLGRKVRCRYRRR